MRKSQNQPEDPVMSALRLPPHSVEAEQSLLGGLLIDNTVWERVGDVVNEADFYRDDHRRIFRQIARLIELGKPADVVTVYEALEKNGWTPALMVGPEFDKFVDDEFAGLRAIMVKAGMI